jgi:hypothetical protein
MCQAVYQAGRRDESDQDAERKMQADHRAPWRIAADVWKQNGRGILDCQQYDDQPMERFCRWRINAGLVFNALLE